MKRQGFTLIELSIVLVVIGLIVGGVLSGQDLIRAAQMRLEVGQLEQLDTAVNTFKSKYQCIPGDCNKAASLSLGIDGNGNGVIDGKLSDTEPADFWQHLSAANLIDGKYPGSDTSGYVPGVDTPPLRLPGLGYENGSGNFNIRGGVLVGNAESYLQTQEIFPTAQSVWILSATTLPGGASVGIYSGLEMQRLDTKIDDGKPVAGKMRAISYEINTAAIFTSGNPEACVDDTTVAPDYIYNSLTLAGAKTACGAIIKPAF